MLGSLFSFGTHGPDGTYGVVIDIGSGSVGAAIVGASPAEETSMLVWSFRERIAVRQHDTSTEATKDINTAILNVFLELSGTGLSALREYDKTGRIGSVRVAVSAPWAYTLTKTVSYKAEEEFTITDEIIGELTETAKREIQKILDSNDLLKNLGLTPISEQVTGVSVNGYLVDEPVEKTATEVSLALIDGVIDTHIVDTLKEHQEKVLPDTKLSVHTFMYTFYQVINHMRAGTSEYALVDITAEATELGIVRDGVLRYVTHIPYGNYTLAREISNLCQVPYEEALGFFRENHTELTSTLSAAKQAELTVIIESYQEQLADLFRRTGDSLSIPKSLFLHADKRTEPFFKSQLESAAKKAYETEHTVHPVTTKLFNKATDADSALLLSTYVFHKDIVN